ncbi:MAG: spore coat protein [Oscillospiraceae bacterium]|nr:spore coat protein [Oscillospiraceae bacterium]
MANLTAKELSAIGDHLAAEDNLVRKYRMYAGTTQDPQIKQKCEEIAQRHQNHFNTLMGHLS